jgi:predicted nicotinamide N-methyase
MISSFLVRELPKQFPVVQQPTHHLATNQIQARTMDDEVDVNQETLECARYGEDDDLRSLLATAGADANYADSNGTTAMHRAAANGQVTCLQVLKEFGALPKGNTEGNLPTHWAALNGQAGALKFLLENFDTDVLAKNHAGRSTLTEAFQSQNTEVIELCLSHPSASEENLMKTDTDNTKVTVDGESGADGYDESHAVVHEMDFSSSLPPDAAAGGVGGGGTLKVRELPITRADSPFGSDTAPEDDTTGLGLWPAAVLLARWAVREKALLQGKTVVELGAGCGLPSLAAARYCAPRSVFLTDIHDPTLKNAAHNARLNGTQGIKAGTADEAAPVSFIEVVTVHGSPNSSNSSSNCNSDTVFRSPVPASCLYVTKVSWSEPATFPPQRADVLLGSDLVYDANILALLTRAVDGMLAPDGVFLYVAPDECRDGIDGLLAALATVGVRCVLQQPCEDWMFENPLADDEEGREVGEAAGEHETAAEGKKVAVDRGDRFVLHFYDLAAKTPHTMYKFARQ